MGTRWFSRGESSNRGPNRKFPQISLLVAIHSRISGGWRRTLGDDRNAAMPFAVSTLVMTRRTAMLVSMGLPAALPALCYPPREFWNEKKPADWTDDERQEMLTKSPWAREGE